MYPNLTTRGQEIEKKMPARFMKLCTNKFGRLKIGLSDFSAHDRNLIKTL